MILVTVGTQIPFDRLIEWVDQIAPRLHGEEIVAQSCAGTYTPRHFTTRHFIQPDQFEQLMDRARIIVAHAGTGTILSAMRRRKPIIVVPRLASLGEHRNDHQLATAKSLATAYHVAVATSAAQLSDLIDRAPVADPLSPTPDPTLIEAIIANI